MEAAAALRPCARCGRDLTDAASVESGIGPHCRNKANEILAKELPAAFDGDRLFHALALTQESFPEKVRGLVGLVQKELYNSRAFNANQAGDDLRKLARRLAYLLSWTHDTGVRTALLDAMRGLGFEGYASYLAGEASPAAGELQVVNGRLFLKSTRNGYATTALRAIPGRWFGENGWSVPLAQAEALVAVVRRFWPLTPLQSALAAVEAARSRMPSVPAVAASVAAPVAAPKPVQAPAPKPVVAQAPSRPMARVHAEGEWLTVETPRRVEAVRTALVALPAKDRWWDSKVFAWKVRAQHRALVEAALAPFFSLAA
jgi:hypothetical protein